LRARDASRFYHIKISEENHPTFQLMYRSDLSRRIFLEPFHAAHISEVDQQTRAQLLVNIAVSGRQLREEHLRRRMNLIIRFSIGSQ
jgi:hypothetical protein